MEIRVLDFGIITSHYVNYQNGVSEINGEKDEFMKGLEPLKKQMNQIISSSANGLILDGKTQQQKIEEFKQLQSEAVEMEREFQYKVKNMTSELNERCYDELEQIVSEWADKNSIDLVTGKMEVIFSNPKYDSTNEILDVLKEKDLFVEVKEKESL
jgi:Skp family chaperone for outer membrane proteins